MKQGRGDRVAVECEVLYAASHNSVEEEAFQKICGFTAIANVQEASTGAICAARLTQSGARPLEGRRIPQVRPLLKHAPVTV
jgi:hypothetical protein